MNPYEVIGKVSRGIPAGQVHMGELMHGTMDRYMENRLGAEATLLEMDVNGGECMRCGKPYRRVDVKNSMIEFHYFEPACSCYPRCMWCGRILHHEAQTNQAHCSNCPSVRCVESSEKFIWNQEEKKKEPRHVRCLGIMKISGKNWRCDVCESVKATDELRADLAKINKPRGGYT